MRFQVSVNVSINPYVGDTDQPSYTQSLFFTDKIDIESATWTDTGVKIDAIVAGLKEALHGDGD